MTVTRLEDLFPGLPRQTREEQQPQVPVQQRKRRHVHVSNNFSPREEDRLMTKSTGNLAQRVENFKEFARLFGFDSAQLAALAEVHPSTTFRILEKNHPISDELAMHLETCLGLPPSWLDDEHDRKSWAKLRDTWAKPSYDDEAHYETGPTVTPATSTLSPVSSSEDLVMAEQTAENAAPKIVKRTRATKATQAAPAPQVPPVIAVSAPEVTPAPAATPKQRAPKKGASVPKAGEVAVSASLSKKALPVAQELENFLPTETMATAAPVATAPVVEATTQAPRATPMPKAVPKLKTTTKSSAKLAPSPEVPAPASADPQVEPTPPVTSEPISAKKITAPKKVKTPEALPANELPEQTALPAGEPLIVVPEAAAESGPEKRGRGRPRKHPRPDPNAVKRGRGRPRKALPAPVVQSSGLAPRGNPSALSSMATTYERPPVAAQAAAPGLSSAITLKARPVEETILDENIERVPPAVPEATILEASATPTPMVPVGAPAAAPALAVAPPVAGIAIGLSAETALASLPPISRALVETLISRIQSGRLSEAQAYKLLGDQLL